MKQREIFQKIGSQKFGCQKNWFPNKEETLFPKRTDEETVRSLRSAAQMAENLPEGSLGVGKILVKTVEDGTSRPN